ncbi:MAG: amidohydrolase, partial [Smithellaceae bacterium]|nr:amidohydrolase [Smithellaceae bacterium]
MNDVDLIISGGTVLTIDRQDRIIPDGAVAIVGELIVATGPAAEIRAEYSAKRTLDAKGGLILPGLVNCHTHAAMTCFRGMADDRELMDWLNNYIFPAEATNVDPELAYWGSLLACAEMISSGTTTFCDMYIFEDETAQAAKDAGMRCLLGEVLFDFPSPNVKSPAEGLAYTEALIKKWQSDPLINIVVEPHSLYTCSPALLKDAKSLADRYGVPLALHLLENEGERRQLGEKLGRRPTEFLSDAGFLNERFIAFHCVCMDERDIELFSSQRARVVYNPESNMKLASGAAPVSAMLAAGVVVGLGTDGCASNNNLAMLAEV